MERQGVVAKNFRTVLVVASALLAAVTLWSTPGFPATADTLSPATSELRQLADLDAALRQALRMQRERLGTECEFSAVRARLVGIQDEAIDAIRRIGALWRGGRLRSGGLAMSEVLVYDLVAVIDEARRDTAVADTLASLEAATHDGSHDARALLRRMIDSNPAAPACLARALEEEDTIALGARILEQVIFDDYLRPRVW